jgi:hypothetical protein
MKKFTALFYFRDAAGQLQSRFLKFELSSLAAAKRLANEAKQPTERLVYVEQDKEVA